MSIPNERALTKLAEITGESPAAVAQWFRIGPQVLGVPEVAELLSVTPHLVGKLFRSGKLPGRKVGREWRTTDVAVAEWLVSDAPTILDAEDHDDT